MPAIEFPQPLQDLLKGTEIEGPIRVLADQVGVILDDNKLVFFPAYTDHGTKHINCVLKSMVDLVPREVWDQSKASSSPRLLGEVDAAVIIGSALLHDIAMHLTRPGFLELVSPTSRFRPLPWFDGDHPGHTGDRPWHELWEDYEREARRFSQRDLTGLIGEKSAQTAWSYAKLPPEGTPWDDNHYLLIGEFIRRHHARLAHEIAIYGFPGLPATPGKDYFPAMGTEEGHALKKYADLIGLTARSHGTSLRVCKDYLDLSGHHAKTPRPKGTAVLYPMALLRVADYLQMDSVRAPAVLLTLRQPPSHISVMEWNKHGAVESIADGSDRRAKMVEVKAGISLPVYLELEKLLKGLQREIDHSSAVLDETYGTLTHLGLHQLGLSIRRVRSSLDEPAFNARLPYVPKATGFSADPNILTLLVEPLYGKYPGVGIRELMQNAVDAVCERKAWHEKHGTPLSTEVKNERWDVLIEYIKRPEDGSWFVRVTDKGLGMTSDTLEKFFLRAGASYRRSPEWAKEFVDDQGKPRVARAGRFGVGAFAVFLLGKSFKLFTRHISAEPSAGYSIEASENSQLIELQREGALPVGTKIETELSEEAVKEFRLEEKIYESSYGLSGKVDWFCWDWPRVVQRVVRGKKAQAISKAHDQPIHHKVLPPEWSIITPSGFDAVHWTYDEAGPLSCNGLAIRRPDPYAVWNLELPWLPKTSGLEAPKVAVTDASASLPLTVQRFGLSESRLPFINELARDVSLSFIAHALVCGPLSREEALLPGRGYPMRMRQVSDYTISRDGDYHGDDWEKPFENCRLRWVADSAGFIPSDPWLFGLLATSNCLVLGSVSQENSRGFLPLNLQPRMEKNVPQGMSVVRWMGEASEGDEDLQETVFSTLVEQGIAGLGHKLKASKGWVSVPHWTSFGASKIWQRAHLPGKGPMHFEASQGELQTPLPLQLMLEEMEASLKAQNEPSWHFSQGDIVFVVQLEVEHSSPADKSVLASIWEECLGPRAIPFDPVKRQQMIEDARQHPEMRRHLEKWEQKKREGTERSHSREDW